MFIPLLEQPERLSFRYEMRIKKDTHNCLGNNQTMETSALEATVIIYETADSQHPLQKKFQQKIM